MLTGSISMDISQEDPLQIFLRNKVNYEILERLYSKLGINKSVFPEVVDSGKIIGTITSKAAYETRLHKCTPVIAGGMDTSAAAYGMGILSHNDSFHVAGQAGAIGVCSNIPVFDNRICIHNHMIPNKWLIVGVMVATGASLRWFRDQMGFEEIRKAKHDCIDPYKVLSGLAETSCEGAGGVIFLPYMMGERSPAWDSHARGTFIGLSLKTSKNEIIRSIMEGAAFALRDNIDVLSSLGLDFDRIICSGGATESDVWNQIKADVTGKEIVIAKDCHTSARGVAFMAGISTGVLSELPKNNELNLIKKIYSPQIKNKSLYEDLFNVYKGLYEKLKDDFKILSMVGINRL
jgi:xylulokinase